MSYVHVDGMLLFVSKNITKLKCQKGTVTRKKCGLMRHVITSVDYLEAKRFYKGLLHRMVILSRSRCKSDIR